MKIYMWLNSLDKECVDIGTKLADGRYFCYACLHIDFISDLFGNEVRQAVQDATTPICIQAFNLRVDGLEIHDQ
jgi:hypothetical protein